MPQLAGTNCVVCGKQIKSILGAEFCPSCGNPVHQACRQGYQPPETGAAQGVPRCPQCGGDPTTAPRDAAIPSRFNPVYFFWLAIAVIIAAVVAYLAWPRVDTTVKQLVTQEALRQQEEKEEAALGNPVVEIKTTMGTIRAELFADKAPKTVANFIDLVNKKFYDGILFHRVIDGFMIQTGDPLGNGTGGRADKGLPAKTLLDEFDPDLRHDQPGILSMANSGPNTGDTQFFITTVPTPWLDDKHSVFGRVIEGMDVVHKIEKAPKVGERPKEDIKMLTVRMVEKKPKQGEVKGGS